MSEAASSDPGRRAGRWSNVVAWGLVVLAGLGVVVRSLLDAANGGIRSDLELDLGASVLFFTFSAVGVLVAIKQPRNPIGWLLLVVGLVFATPFVAYARYAEVTRGGELPGAGLALAFDSPAWVVFIGLSGFVLMLFPDGHLPSPRWRWFARVCAVGLSFLYLGILFAPDQGVDYELPQVENPVGVESIDRAGGALYILVPFAPLTVLGGAVAIIVRSRRTKDPIQRQQLRWLKWAGSLIASFYILAFPLPAILGLGDAWENWIGTVAAASFVLIPIAVGIAVLRYRLYDIDIVIKKTVVATVMVVLIAVVYVAVVAGVGAIVGSRSSPLLSALAAAIVALVFQPLRTRARRLADRVVYGKRATPYEVLSDFSERVGETYAADDVLSRMARVVGEGIGAERAEVWIKIGDEDRLAAVWPADAHEEAPSDGSTSTFPVEHHGEMLGALAVVAPVNDPMDPARDKLVEDLAAQAGLVLRNVHLTEELRAKLNDLRAAQRRLVAAQDTERKRLERNLHDGAQQQLVALAMKLRLADRQVDADPERAHAMLAEIQQDATQALDDLRDLARGIYPPLLADEGLEAALASQARRAVLPVEVQVHVEVRPPPDVEAAVYFSCLESLQNVAKYAEASRAWVRVASEDGHISFEVGDDGRGFEPSANGYGTGLQGIADRLGALDGTVRVVSAPGEGTTVMGQIPLA